MKLSALLFLGLAASTVSAAPITQDSGIIPNTPITEINEKRQLAGTGDVVEGVANSLLTFLSSAVGATVGDAVDLLAVVTERVLGGVVGGAAGALNGVVETRAENVNGALD